MRNGISFMANTENIIIDQENAGTKQLEAVDLMLCGRRKIFTAEDDINRDNIVSVLNDILSMHIFNYQQEEYLYWYRRGVQPILNRTREVRPELVKHVIVNNANQIVTFKNGYFMQEPCSYSSRIDDERVTEQVKRFNEYCYASGKAIVDNEIVDWFDTVGLGVLYIDPDRDGNDRVPFRCYALDPRSAFCAYSYKPGNKRVLGVNIVVDNGVVMLDAFTR